MPTAEELEQMLDERDERSLLEFPDDDAWRALKDEVSRLHAPDPEEVEDGDR